MELADHLFRHEAGRITAALTKVFGIHNLDLVEDVVQEAFCQALATWAFRGVPENPSAWLMTAAKHKALDALRRKRTIRIFAAEMGRLLESEWTLAPTVAEVFEPAALRDEQLRMMFSCCHPNLPEESQVGLILHILCGFSVDEIAAAFVATHTAIEKRLPRAKKVLAESGALFDVTAAADFSIRLPAVQRALYLLFNEGYHGASPESAVRADLCVEAIRLCTLLLEHPPAATPATCALAALMNLHAARLPARLDAQGNLLTLLEQDRCAWDQERLSEGLRLLELSAREQQITTYHLQAAIAAVHAQASSQQFTDWAAIIALYDALLTLEPSPIIALNRAIAIGQIHGPDAGLQAIGNIAGPERLATYPFFHAAIGEFESRRGNHAAAQEHFATALQCARNVAERQFFERRIAGNESS